MTIPLPIGEAARPVQPYADFREAAEGAVAFLRERVGFDLWMVTRTEGDDWIILEASANDYGVQRGQVFPWEDTFCSRMVAGAPRIAPRAADVDEYRAAGINDLLEIGAYVGIPLLDREGELFGTLCAIDPAPQSDGVRDDEALAAMFARLLGTVLQQDLRATEDARRLELARAVALTDELTGLPNRRAWEQFLDQEEARCQRFGHAAAVVMIDLDGLKAVNDEKGHAAGDELLRVAAATVRAACRASDLPARLGGDEFGVLAPETDAEACAVMARRLADRLEGAGVAASIGTAQRRPDATLRDAMTGADVAMYERKRSRRAG